MSNEIFSNFDFIMESSRYCIRATLTIAAKLKSIKIPDEIGVEIRKNGQDSPYGHLQK